MKATDKFLIGIVAGAIVLVVVALVVISLRPKASYQADDSPEHIAYNYLFAMRQREYARAYGYLAPELKGYPLTLEKFEDDVQCCVWEYAAEASDIAMTSIYTGTTRIQVTFQETRFYANGGLFNTRQDSTTFDMWVEWSATAQAWRITDSARYWAACWDERAGCK